MASQTLYLLAQLLKKAFTRVQVRHSIQSHCS